MPNSPSSPRSPREVREWATRPENARKILTENRRRCTSRSLADFIPAISPRYAAPTHLQPLVDLLERVARGEAVRAVVHTPPRHGKAIACDTPMLTRRGWVPAGEVSVGDFLVGRDGGWTRVEGVYPQGRVPLFRVDFSDGAALVTCAEHRWLVEQRYGYAPTVRTTAHLAATLSEGDGRARWRIPVVNAFRGEDSPTPIDPYLLGLWLGDGTTKQAAITTADPEIVEAFRAAGFATSYETPTGAAKTYGLLGFRPALRAAGVLGNKHVPDGYALGSVATRLAVLQGLADTDGTVAKNGSQQSVTVTSERLACDIKWLVNSLGGTWTEYVRPAARKLAHTIHFRLPCGMDGFRLARKRSRLAPWGARNRPRRLVKSVESVGDGEAVCFAVDAPDHLFCAGRELVVTHNTETLLHALAWLLVRDPTATCAYASYAAELARSKSRRARQFAQLAGVQFADDAGRLEEWRTTQGGGLLATGIGGPLTGHGVDRLLVVDDPVKNRVEAESRLLRDRHAEWFGDVAFTRLDGRGGVIVNMARWHPDDLAGRLIAQGWQEITLPALSPEGVALWPERFDVEKLAAIRAQVGEYTWASLYQGRPRSRGGAVFEGVSLYEVAPADGLRIAIGVDLAYSTRTHADYSVAVVLGGRGEDAFVLDAKRAQVRAPEFATQLEQLVACYPGAPLWWYASGTEKGSADFMRSQGVPIQARAPSGDKFTRAQPVAAAWNAGHVKVPRAALWANAFVAECADFTGIGDVHDDQVDALAAAFDALATSVPVAPPMLSRLSPGVSASGWRV